MPPVSAYDNGCPSTGLVRDIVADAPWRVETASIPILIFINDAQQVSLCGPPAIPVPEDYVLGSVQIRTNSRLLKEAPYNITISNEGYGLIYDDAWYDIINLPTSGTDEQGNPYDLSNSKVKLSVTIIGKSITPCSEAPVIKTYNLPVEIVDKPLPKFDNWKCGDTHHHTIYTDNPVPLNGELGAPVQASMEAAKAIGLDWVTVTDHSDDMTSDEKWNSFKSLCGGYDEDDGIVCIPSEEVTCGWFHWPFYDTDRKLPALPIGGFSNGVSHYLSYGLNNWISGLAYGTVHSCPYVVKEVNRQGVGYVAHPMDTKVSMTIPISNQDWGVMIPWQDYSLNTSGYEVWNVENETEKFKESLGGYDDAIINNTEKQIYISGGSDAHGEFNDIFSKKGAFGKPRTCCEMRSLDQDNVLDALRNGRCYFGNGPALKFSIDGKGLGETVIDN